MWIKIKHTISKPKLGFYLIIASYVIWFGISGVPFLPVGRGWKIGIIAAIWIFSEAVFWVGVLLLGYKAVRKIKEAWHFFRRNKGK